MIIAHLFFLRMWLKYLHKLYREEPLIDFFYIGFFLKVFAGLLYAWVYIVYYGGVGDSLNYYKDAKILADFAFQNPKGYFELLFWNKFFVFNDFSNNWWLEPRALLMIKIVSLLNIITLNNYWIAGFYLSFGSFWAMWSWANSLVKYFPKTKYAAVFAFLLFPTVLFWSSGYTKESFVMIALGFLMTGFIKIISQNSLSTSFWLKYTFMSSIAILFLWLLKPYYLIFLLPFCIAYLLTIKLLQFIPFLLKIYLKHSLSQFVLLCLVLLSFVLIFYAIRPQFSIKPILVDMAINHNRTYIFSKQDDLIHFSIYPNQGYISITDDLSNLLLNAPLALVSALYRPFLWEVGANKLKILASLENLFILLMSIYAVYQYIRHPIAEQSFIKKNQVLLAIALSYICLSYIFLAIVSPNFGSLSRYKIAASPILVYLICIAASFRLEKKINQIKKAFAKNTISQEPEKF